MYYTKGYITINIKSNFEYNQDWYDKCYHGEIFVGNYKPDPTHFHLDRDIECLKDLGVTSQHKILMCGCGAGDDIYILDKYFNCHKVHGVDFSTKAVAFCNEYFPWVKAHVSCVSKLPFKDETFDILCAMDVTEHLTYEIYTRFLLEIYRVLKPGGKIAMLPGMTNLPEHINILTLAEIASSCRNIGFKIPIFKKEWFIGERDKNE